MAGRYAKITADWFPHDSSAFSGRTIRLLKADYGNEGYAVWFQLLEALCRNDGLVLDLSDELDQEYYAREFDVSSSILLDIVDRLAELGAIDRDLWVECQIVFSENLVENLAPLWKRRKLSIIEKPNFQKIISARKNGKYVNINNISARKNGIYAYQNMSAGEFMHAEIDRVEKSRVEKSRNNIVLAKANTRPAAPSTSSEKTGKNTTDKKVVVSKKSDSFLSESAKVIIGYLNARTNQNYRSTTQSTVRHISARLKEGFSPQDFKTVIDNKTEEWLDDAKMAKYLRPETLFGPKFESYLNEKHPPPKGENAGFLGGLAAVIAKEQENNDENRDSENTGVYTSTISELSAS